MFYLDTSVLGALFLNEPRSGSVLLWAHAHQSRRFVISPWVSAEIPSMLGRLVRKGVYTTQQGDQLQNRISKWLAIHCQQESVYEIDFQRAAIHQLKWHLGLRAGDALHLAICERLDLCIISLDRKLFEVAVHLDVAALDPSTFSEEKK
jgi:uncharacterized protein